MNLLYSFESFILDCLFPVFCYGCGQEGLWLCRICQEKLLKTSPTCIVCKKITFSDSTHVLGVTCRSCKNHTSIHRFYSPFSYQDPLIRLMIHDIKYARLTSLIPELSHAVFKALSYFRVTFPSDAIFIPIPMHRRRKNHRGFNQSALLAKVLASLFGALYNEDILIKPKPTLPQVGLSLENRLTNLQGSFEVKDKAEVRGKCVVLVDDVKTTGSTLEIAARVLKEAGAREIIAITIAH